MISLHIPKDSKIIDLSQEISSARNIKDKSNQKATLTGLNKINSYL